MRKKGQSATEYLMTYGWALLAIAIVGALLYMYVFSNKGNCTQKVSGFNDQGVVVLEGQYVVYTDGRIRMQLENRLDSNATITRIDVGSSSCTPNVELTPSQKIEVGDGTSYCTNLVAEAGNENTCKSIPVKITYNIQGGISGKVSSGTIIAKYVKP